MTRNEYLTKNRSYLGKSAEVIEMLTDEQFSALIDITRKMGNADPGIDNDLVKTHETINDFNASREGYWNLKGDRAELFAGNFDAVIYRDFQMRKGQPRRAAMGIVEFDGFSITLA